MVFECVILGGGKGFEVFWGICCGVEGFREFWKFLWKCGLMRCDVVWCGVMWCGVMRCGVMRCGLMGCVIRWRALVWFVVEGRNVMRCDVGVRKLSI